LIGREVLVPDDQHMMIDESLVQPTANLRINRLAAIEAAHLGAGVIRQLRNSERRHRVHSRNL
jgi:hypothetical protein